MKFSEDCIIFVLLSSTVFCYTIITTPIAPLQYNVLCMSYKLWQVWHTYIYVFIWYIYDIYVYPSYMQQGKIPQAICDVFICMF